MGERRAHTVHSSYGGVIVESSKTTSTRKRDLTAMLSTSPGAKRTAENASRAACSKTSG